MKNTWRHWIKWSNSKCIILLISIMKSLKEKKTYFKVLQENLPYNKSNPHGGWYPYICFHGYKSLQCSWSLELNTEGYHTKVLGLCGASLKCPWLLRCARDFLRASVLEYSKIPSIALAKKYRHKSTRHWCNFKLYMHVPCTENKHTFYKMYFSP